MQPRERWTFMHAVDLHSVERMSLEVPPPPNDSTNALRDDMSAPAFLNEPSYKEEIW